MSLINQLLDPHFSSSDPRVNLRQLNRDVHEHQAKKGESLYMRQTLMLNQQRLDTAEAFYDEMEENCETMREFNREVKDLHLDV